MARLTAPTETLSFLLEQIDMNPMEEADENKMGTVKCAHLACVCMVSADGEFCSDACSDQAEASPRTAACGCGHPECSASPH